jgi:hypothetical protein
MSERRADICATQNFFVCGSAQIYAQKRERSLSLSFVAGAFEAF